MSIFTALKKLLFRTSQEPSPISSSPSKPTAQVNTPVATEKLDPDMPELGVALLEELKKGTTPLENCEETASLVIKNSEPLLKNLTRPSTIFGVFPEIDKDEILSELSESQPPAPEASWWKSLQFELGEGAENKEKESAPQTNAEHSIKFSPSSSYSAKFSAPGTNSGRTSSENNSNSIFASYRP